MCTFSRCRSKFLRTRGHVRSQISGGILVSWFVTHQSSSVLHTSKNSTIGGIVRHNLPATSTRMRLLIKSFYSSFSSFIFSYEATAYQDVNFERVFLWFRFLYIVEHLLLVNHQKRVHLLLFLWRTKQGG